MNPEMWARQTAIPGFGVEGQQRLHESRAVVLGLGGVGGPRLPFIWQLRA